jgi:hypothetical protein
MVKPASNTKTIWNYVTIWGGPAVLAVLLIMGLFSCGSKGRPEDDASNPNWTCQGDSLYKQTRELWPSMSPMERCVYVMKLKNKLITN